MKSRTSLDCDRLWESNEPLLCYSKAPPRYRSAVIVKRRLGARRYEPGGAGRAASAANDIDDNNNARIKGTAP